MFDSKIISVADIDKDYEIKFLKRSPKIKSWFIYPEEDDLASVSHADIIFVLQPPKPVVQTARLSNIFRFSENLTKLCVLA